jgi:hypothetical protein
MSSSRLLQTTSRGHGVHVRKQEGEAMLKFDSRVSPSRGPQQRHGAFAAGSDRSKTLHNCFRATMAATQRQLADVTPHVSCES